jgi:hypothetical protein
MPLRRPEKSEWRTYCDRLSKHLATTRSEPVTASLVLNDKVVAEWVPLLGVTYEPKKDLFAILLQDFGTGSIVRGRSMWMKGPAE